MKRMRQKSQTCLLWQKATTRTYLVLPRPRPLLPRKHPPRRPKSTPSVSSTSHPEQQNSSAGINKPTIGSMAILGEISISGTIIKADELANVLQVCLDSGAVPAELVGSFNLIFYQSAEDAVFKALGVE